MSVVLGPTINESLTINHIRLSFFISPARGINVVHFQQNLGPIKEVNYHPETGWLGVRGFKDSRVQGVVKKSTMPLLESLTPGPLES